MEGYCFIQRLFWLHLCVLFFGPEQNRTLHYLEACTVRWMDGLKRDSLLAGPTNAAWADSSKGGINIINLNANTLA